MEYSTISMLNCFVDILANVGLPEAWLEWDSNDVTQIKDKSVKCEANLTEKLSRTRSKTVRWIESEAMGRIKAETKSLIESETKSWIKSEPVSRIKSGTSELDQVKNEESDQFGTVDPFYNPSACSDWNFNLALLLLYTWIKWWQPCQIDFL